jgi:hypothetical protein
MPSRKPMKNPPMLSAISESRASMIAAMPAKTR